MLVELTPSEAEAVRGIARITGKGEREVVSELLGLGRDVLRAALARAKEQRAKAGQ